MKVCVTGDFHGTEPPVIPDCDLLLLHGDLGHHPEYIEPWLEEIAGRGINVCAVAGNHDFDVKPYQRLDEKGLWRFLDNEADEIDDLVVFGSPLSPPFNNWAHMRPEDDLRKVWETIPTEVDIILVHGPPHGYGDKCPGGNVGSTSLRKMLDEGVWPNLKLVACGHIHEGYGISYAGLRPGDGHVLGAFDFRVVNGSWVDGHYTPGQPPIVVEL